MSERNGRIGILWREAPLVDGDPRAKEDRLRPIFDALSARNIAAEPVLYADDRADEARARLRRLDGVLVWVDPIDRGRDRRVLDPMLREVASRGVWVSAHPDVILKMGTKEVLFRTRDVGWSPDAHVYRTLTELRDALPARLISGGPRVLKQDRGNGGIGVWKVETVATPSAPTPRAGAPAAAPAPTTVRIQHAHRRDNATEDVPLSEFIDRCAQYFAGGGLMVDQPFQPRVVDGMVRCYMVSDEVVGFAHQRPDATSPDAPASGDAAPRRILGLPSAKTMYRPDAPRFARLKSAMESGWLPAMLRELGLDASSLPVLWDADFLYGPRTAAGDDTYVLCEINVSCVSPFPEQAVPKIADCVSARLRSGKPPDAAT